MPTTSYLICALQTFECCLQLELPAAAAHLPEQGSPLEDDTRQADPIQQVPSAHLCKESNGTQQWTTDCSGLIQLAISNDAPLSPIGLSSLSALLRHCSEG